MAYSNYGAFIWKNGEEVTKQCADKSYEYKDGVWQLEDEDHTDFGDDELVVGGHAILPLGNNILLEFYKTHTLNIYTGNVKENVDIEKKILEKAKYTYKKKIEIIGYCLDLNESIYFYEIKYNGDVWCVIIGASFGAGFDDYKISKYVKRRLTFDEGPRFYHINHKSEYEFDYWCRQSDIQHEKSMRWWFGIKPFIKDLLKFKFGNAGYHLHDIIEYSRNIKYMK